MKIFQLCLFISISILILLNPSSVIAKETINNFDVEIVVHKNGDFEVTENITYDFGPGKGHGIFRDIPLITSVGNLYRIINIDVKSVGRNGESEKYIHQGDSSKVSLKIGKADTEITGSHTYQISYTVKNGIGSNYEDHDEIYWNITGNDWSVPTERASVQLKTDFDVKPDKAICFTGRSGSKDRDCDFGKISSISTTKPLRPREGLTAVWNFPKDTFPDSVLQTQDPDKVSSTSTESSGVIVYLLVGVAVTLNIILPAILLFWYYKTKSKKRFGPPVVNFDFPEGTDGKRITPAEAGSIDAYLVDQNDIIATIFDLAIRKYIKIEQTKEEKILGIFGSDEDYRIIKLKDPNEGTTVFEQRLLHRLFQDGDKVEVNSLNDDFYETFQKVEEEVFESLIKRGFYKKNPKNQMGGLLVLGLVIMCFGAVVSGLVLIYLSRKLNGRTRLGDEVDWKLDGLKLFLKNMSRNYTWQANNLYTVEKYIPYAIAFGYIKEFMEQLKVIYPDYHPNWYSGNASFYLVSSSMFHSMNTSFTTHASSSSSGFSGGGSSGGGGGGGGGGSW